LIEPLFDIILRREAWFLSKAQGVSIHGTSGREIQSIETCLVSTKECINVVLEEGEVDSGSVEGVVSSRSRTERRMPKEWGKEEGREAKVEKK
jgi:hypothetical protein